MQSLYISIVRTVVPYLVGFVVSVLTAQGIEASDDLKLQLASFLTFAFGAAYYIIVRFLARKFPKLEWLLGAPTKPVYKTTK